jgi:hypothetical protein
MGGAIFARAGQVTLLDSFFTGNEVLGGAGGGASAHGGGGGGGFGAAIFGHSADIRIERCQVSANESFGGQGLGYADIGGGACGVSSGPGGEAEGAGLLVFSGSVSLDTSTFESNSATGGEGGRATAGGKGGWARGGAIAVHGGVVSIWRTTLHSNHLFGGNAETAARVHPDGGGAVGGALWVGGGILELENCTLSSNSARGADTLSDNDGTHLSGMPGASLGGALALAGSDASHPPTAFLRFCTVAFNRVEPSEQRQRQFGTVLRFGQTEGGGLHQTSGLLRLQGTLCADNQSVTSADIHGTVESLARNLVQDPGGALGLQSHDLVGVDPLLTPLGANGGLTSTHVLLPGSPAVDAADPADVPAIDQRGVVRPQGAFPDLGAVEAEFGDPNALRVTTTADSGPGSLRSAILAANDRDGADVDLRQLQGRIVLLSALPEITGSIRLLGPESETLIVSGGGSEPILSFGEGAYAEVSHLTLSDALAPGYRNGGSISNAGTLVLESCVVSRNRTEGGWGAGIYNQGHLSLLNCVVATNLALGEGGASGFRGDDPGPSNRGPGGGAAGLGGGIFHERGTLIVSNCVFEGNQALGGSGGSFAPLEEETITGRGGGPAGGLPATPGFRAEAGFGSGGGGGGRGGFGGGGGGLAPGEDSGGFGAGDGSLCDAAGGGAGMGAAIFARAGKVTLLDTLFVRNRAQGGSGGDGLSQGGGGGGGLGAAVFSHGAEVQMHRCRLLENEAEGGRGGSSDGVSNANFMCTALSGRGGEARAAGVLIREGSLQLSTSLVASNLTMAGDGGGGWAYGSGIAAHGGDVSIRQTTLHSNRLLGSAAVGGAVWIGGGQATVENSTLSANHVRGGEATTREGARVNVSGVARGGGLAVAGTAITTGFPILVQMNYCTVAFNKVQMPDSVGVGTTGEPTLGEVQGAGLYQEEQGALQLAGTICAANEPAAAGDVYQNTGGIWEISVNLIQTPVRYVAREGTLVGVDPMLGPLDDHGGFTPTHALLDGSPALDAADLAGFPPRDQRGSPRPSGAGTDLGAFESDLSASFRLWILQPQPGLHGAGQVRTTVSGISGSVAALEFSTNFVNWKYLRTLFNGEAYLHPASGAPVYFRARRN